MSELKLAWCNARAATYAVKHWHYSGSLPFGKTGKIGVWEDGKFVGCVIFGRPASSPMAKKMKLMYGLGITQFCELCRVALAPHKTPVTRILSICLKMFRKKYPPIRLIVSFADTGQGHHGGIYQGGNWVYTGRSKGAASYMVRGRKIPQQTAELYGFTTLAGAQRLDPNATMVMDDKHRYLMAMDPEIAKIIEKERKPYPKRAK